MVSNMLGIRGTPPVKELGAAGTTADRCVLFLPYVVVFAVATAVLLLLIYLLQGLKPYVQQRVTSNGNNYTIGGGLFTEKKEKKSAVFQVTYSARRGGKKPLVFWSQFSGVQCTEHRHGSRPGSRHGL